MTADLVTDQLEAIELASWQDAWLHELRGPDGKWVHNVQAIMKATTRIRARSSRRGGHVMYGNTGDEPRPYLVLSARHPGSKTVLVLKNPDTGEQITTSVKSGQYLDYIPPQRGGPKPRAAPAHQAAAPPAPKPVPAPEIRTPAAGMAPPGGYEGAPEVTQRSLNEARQIVDTAGLSSVEHEVMSRELARNLDKVPGMQGVLKHVNLSDTLGATAITGPDTITFKSRYIHDPGLLTRGDRNWQDEGFLVGDTPLDTGPYAGLRYTMTHEFGHAVTWKVGKNKTPAGNSKTQRALAGAIAGHPFPTDNAGLRQAQAVLSDHNVVGTTVSKYASSNWGELSAESYAGWSLGGTGTAAQAGLALVQTLDGVLPTQCIGLPEPLVSLSSQIELGGYLLAEHIEMTYDPAEARDAAGKWFHGTAYPHKYGYPAPWETEMANDGSLAVQLAGWEHEARGPDGRWVRGGTGTIERVTHPIGDEGARGNSRAVSEAEFHQLAAEGKDRLHAIQHAPWSTDGLHASWPQVKDRTWAEVRKSWGGSTVDPRTGRDLPQGADKFAMSVKPTGMDTTSIPEDSSREAFSQAMDAALAKYGNQLAKGGSYLGIFHDDDLGRIDIDPVTVLDSLREVETIGAYTHAIGGAYRFSDGNGYWPPHVPGGAQMANDGQHWEGPGQWHSQAVAVQQPHDEPDDADDSLSGQIEHRG